VKYFAGRKITVQTAAAAFSRRRFFMQIVVKISGKTAGNAIEYNQIIFKKTKGNECEP